MQMIRLQLILWILILMMMAIVMVLEGLQTVVMVLVSAKMTTPTEP